MEINDLKKIIKLLQSENQDLNIKLLSKARIIIDPPTGFKMPKFYDGIYIEMLEQKTFFSYQNITYISTNKNNRDNFIESIKLLNQSKLYLKSSDI